MQHNDVAPNAAFFTVVQLPQDLEPKPAAQRILMMINANGEMRTYVSENAYIRVECMDILHALIRQAYAGGVQQGGAALYPQPTRIHWCRFTNEFIETGKGDRVEPHKEFVSLMEQA